jgi:hypothetical protein
MRYLMMPPDRNDATRRLVGVNRAIGHPISRQERPGSLDGAPLRFRGLVAGGPRRLGLACPPAPMPVCC